MQEISAHEFRVSVEGRELEVTLSGAEEVVETDHLARRSRRRGPRPLSRLLPQPSGPRARRRLPPLVPASLPPLPPTPDAAAPGVVKAPMPGTITAVEVKAGDTVKAAQVLVKLEAMKMVNAIKSPGPGRIGSVRVQPGESVGYGHVLVTFDEA